MYVSHSFKMSPIVSVAIFLSYLAIANGQSSSCSSGSTAADNTLGTCQFDGQLWINDDCTKVGLTSFNSTLSVKLFSGLLL